VSVAIVQSDAVALLKAQPSESVDLLLTDPAYESLEKHRARGTTTRLKQSDGSSNEWFSIFPNSRFIELFTEAYRVLRPARHAYVLCDDETSDAVKLAAQVAGFYLWNTLTWVKGQEREDADPKLQIGMGYHYRRCSERIVFLEKRTRRFEFTLPKFGMYIHENPLFAGPQKGGGVDTSLHLPTRPHAPGEGRPLNSRSIPEVLFYPAVKAGYPTEKPVGLLALLIGQSTEPGELVIDPFGGSGSTAVAARLQGRRAIIGDTSDKAIAHMRERLGEAG
jgi:site-specific DNA-methyltransferase (adenine-specific)